MRYNPMTYGYGTAEGDAQMEAETNLPITLEGSTQVRIHYDDKKLYWVIRIEDKEGMAQELHSKSEPSILVYMKDGFSEKPVMRKYPSDVIAEYLNQA